MIREAIKNRINDLDLSQREICVRIGLLEQNLSSFLCGGRALSLRKLTVLLELLGLTIGKAGDMVGAYSPTEIRIAVKESVAEHNLRLKELSTMCGVNESSISLFLKGRRLLELNSLERIMSALKLDLVSYGQPKIQ